MIRRIESKIHRIVYLFSREVKKRILVKLDFQKKWEERRKARNKRKVEKVQNYKLNNTQFLLATNQSSKKNFLEPVS